LKSIHQKYFNPLQKFFFIDKQRSNVE
jgi:hypothetical protein